MKLKVLVGALVWSLFITALHVQLNVGWRELQDRLKVLVGMQRAELVVGFLPVT